MRLLGIDFGEQRIGLAISDEDGRVATPFMTLGRRSDLQAAAEIAAIARREEVGGFVVGEPRGLDGQRGAAAARIAAFAEKLARTSGLPCELVEETLTSVAAAERLRGSGRDARRQRALIDAVAAQIILQETLDRRRGAR